MVFGRQRRKTPAEATDGNVEQGISNSTDIPTEKSEHHHNAHLPGYNHNGHKVTKGIKPEGESGRKWIHPWHFVRICARSSCRVSMIVNILWPFVPAAIAIHFARPHDESDSLHRWRFALNYIAMVPTANLIGFAGQELARKLPKVFGVLFETFLGGLVEIVLFMVLIRRDTNGVLIPVIRAAILGSVLANLLLCLGTCFFVGGLRREEQVFHEVVSEVGSNLLLVAGFGLLIPTAYYASISLAPSLAPEVAQEFTDAVNSGVLRISRITAIILFIAFFFYAFFQMRSHHGIFDAVLEEDEEKDHDRHKDLAKDKLTFTECIVALGIALACVSLHAVFLVEEIEPIVLQGHISDSFMGLILVPVVEKLAEHLTAVDEAWDNQMNFALAHVLGATIQTALFNSSLVVLVGWGLHKSMDLNFEVFNIVALILAIIVVGNFLRDQKSNYLEGALCIMVYIIIAVAAWYYPNLNHGLPLEGEGGHGAESGAEGHGAESSAAESPAAEAAHRLLRYALR